MAGAIALLLFAAAIRAEAMPIRPDLKKVLAQPPEQPAQFAPARAGWDGPEMPRRAQLAPNATLEALGPAAGARAVRASLIAAAVPDYRAVAGILLVILLLRRIRKTHQKQESLDTPANLAVMPPPNRSIEETTIERAA